MRCGHCAAEFEGFPGTGHCPTCDGRLDSLIAPATQACPCGAANKPGAKFCRKCGKPLGAPPSEAVPVLREDAWTPVPAPVVPPVLAPPPELAPAPPPVRPPLAPSIASAPTTGAPKGKGLIFAAAGVLGAAGLLAMLALRSFGPKAESPIVTTDPIAQAPPSVSYVPIQPEVAWFLKGGELSGGFVPPAAQADWPAWMQALVGDRENVATAELEKADFYKIPDTFLAHAVQVLAKRKVFSLDMLKRISSIGYAADTSAWQKARCDYQKEWLRANPLPSTDPATCARVLTQLVRGKEYTAARQALLVSSYPGDAAQRASYLRMVELEEGTRKPSAAMVQDASLPAGERFTALQALPGKEVTPDLVANLKGLSPSGQDHQHRVKAGLDD